MIEGEPKTAAEAEIIRRCWNWYVGKTGELNLTEPLDAMRLEIFDRTFPPDETRLG